MNSEYDFTNGEQVGNGNPNAWGNIDAKTIQNELGELTARINEATSYLDKFVYYGDYEKMSKLYQNLWADHIGPGGWLQSFYNSNKADMDKYASGNSRPSYYFDMPEADQKAFDVAADYYNDISHLVPVAEALRVAMMEMPLLDGYMFQRFVLNFTEAGFMESLYHKINDDIREISQLINNSWTYFESRADYSRRFYESNYRTMAKGDLNRGYRQARIKDHQFNLEASSARDSFVARSDGTYSVSPSVLAEMKVLDKYTEQVAYTENIEDKMEKTMNAIRTINSTSLPIAFKNCRDKQCMGVAEALSKLAEMVFEFASTSKNVYKRFKDRDDESPYIFMRPLPALSSMQAKYSLVPISNDPWHDGTRYYTLYQNAADALSQHCREFVQREHPELK